LVSIEDMYQTSILHNGIKPQSCRSIPRPSLNFTFRISSSLILTFPSPHFLPCTASTIMTMACRYGHFLADFNPVHTKYVTPGPGAIHVAYKTQPSNLSQKLTHFTGSRPRDDVYRPRAYHQTAFPQPSEVVIYQPTPRNYHHHRHDPQDPWYPIHYTHVHGTKRDRSHDDVVRLERRFSHAPAVTTATKHVHSRYMYEHERRLPPAVTALPLRPHGCGEPWPGTATSPSLPCETCAGTPERWTAVLRDGDPAEEVVRGIGY
jgi:hypothetical protein